MIVTPDQLREIDFKLAKDLDTSTGAAAGAIKWTLEFGLKERKKATDPFVEVVKLTVNIKPELHEKAQQTLDSGSLDSAQTSQAFAAGDSAKLLSQKKISKATANADAQRIISRRGANG